LLPPSQTQKRLSEKQNTIHFLKNLALSYKII